MSRLVLVVRDTARSARDLRNLEVNKKKKACRPNFKLCHNATEHAVLTRAS